MADNFDFDIDDFDSLDLEGSGDAYDSVSPNDKRAVVQKVVRDFGSGVKSGLDIDTIVDKLVDNAVPDELQEPTTDFLEVKYTVEDIYREATKELKPQIKKLSRLASKAIPDKGILGKISKKLSDFGKESDGYLGQTEEDRIRRVVEGFLPSLKESETVKELYKDQKEQVRWKREIDALGAIATNTSNLFNYESDFTYRYQTKSLELKYRTLISLQQLVSLVKSDNETIRRQLEAIVTNTALPEVLKITKTERFKEMIRDSTLGQIQDSMFGKGTWFGAFMENVKNSVREQISMVGSILEQATAGIEQVNDLSENMAEFGPVPGKGQIIGSEASRAGIGRLFKALKSKIDNNPRLASRIKDAAVLYTNLPSVVRDYVSELDEDSIRKRLGEGFLSLADINRTNTAVGSVGNIESPAIYDNRTRTSIVDIIPGYLKYIHAEVHALRTGKDPIMLEWNYGSGKFVTSTGLKDTISKKLESQVSSFARNSDMEDLLDSLLPNSASPEQRQALKKEILSLVTSRSTYSTKDILSAAWDAGVDINITKENQLSLVRKLNSVRASLPEIGNFVRSVIESGHANYLDNILDIEDGRYSINMEKYIQLISGEKPKSEQHTSGLIPYDMLSPTDKDRLNSVLSSGNVDNIADAGIVMPNTNQPLVDLDKLLQASKATGGFSSSSTRERSVIETEITSQTVLLSDILNILGSISVQIDNIDIGTDPLSINKEKAEKAGRSIRNKFSSIRKGFKNSINKTTNIGSVLFKTTMERLRSITPTSVLTKGVSSITSIFTKLSSLGATVYKSLTTPLEIVTMIAKSTAGAMMSGINKIPNMAVKMLRAGGKIGKDTYDRLFRLSEKVTDIYVSGSLEPALRASAIQMGLYVDARTGKIIRSLSDITGPVLDLDGNMVLSTGDFTKGLVDKYGNKIRVGKEHVRSIASATLSSIRKLAARIAGYKSENIDKVDLSKLGNLSSITKSPTGEQQLQEAEFAINTNIYKLAKDRNDILLRILDAVDGDNIRKGSWRERLRKDKKEDEKEKNKDIGKTSKSTKSKTGDSKGVDLTSIIPGAGLLSGALSEISNKAGDVAKGAAGLYGLKKAKDILTKKSPTKIIDEGVEKELRKRMSTKTGAKIGAKAGAKFIAKRIPIISAITGLGYGFSRLFDGDITGAAGEVASGIVSTVPWIGTAAGLGIDAWLANRDMSSNGDAVPMDDIEKKALSYIQYQMGANKESIIKLHPAVRALFLRMVKEYYDITGKKVHVNSGYRTPDDQRRLKDRNKNAGGQKSMHTYGFAIDINTEDANAMEELGLMKKYGFTRPIGGETWHIEPAGLQLDLNRARNDPEWAIKAIFDSVGHGGGGYGTMQNARHKGRDIRVATSAYGAATSASTIVPISKTKGAAIPTATATVGPPRPGVVQAPMSDIAKPVERIEETLYSSLEVQKEILNVLKEYASSKTTNSENTEKKQERPNIPPRPKEAPRPMVSLRRTY